MADDWTTINMNRERVTREFEALRKRYQDHRGALSDLLADAPSEHLAQEYESLIKLIDQAVARLVDLERREPATLREPRPQLSVPAAKAAQAPNESRSARGSWSDAPVAEATGQPVASDPPPSRFPIYLVLAALAIAAAAFAMWRVVAGPGSDEKRVVEQIPDTSTVSSDTMKMPPALAEALTIAPEIQEFGTIRKGARAARQFEIANTTDKPLTVKVERSACRCLWFEYSPTIPPKGTTSLTVSIDGSKARKGTLREKVLVSAKEDPAVATSADVTANIE